MEMINFNERVTSAMKESSRMLEGDLWLEGKGLAIQKPPINDPKYQEIREGFATQNVLEEVSDRRRDGILGREPRWNLIPESGEELSESDRAEIERMLAAVVSWWNERKVLDAMKEMLTVAHCERRISFRPYASTDAFETNTTNLRSFASYRDALDNLFFQTARADTAGVFREKETERPFSVYKFKRDTEEVTELSFVSPVDKKTHVAQISQKDADGLRFLQENFPNSLADYAQKLINRQAQDETVNYAPLDLRGHLYLHELDLKKVFINEAMKSLQKQISLILTMDGRNIYAAGIRKEHHLNTEPPKVKQVNKDTGKEEWADAPIKQGAGVRNFLQGVVLYDKQGNIIGRANPGVVIVDPVSSGTFIESANDKRARILAMADQLHVLMSDSAAASGVSRKEARDEFRKSLADAKTPLDALGRYIIEFAVMYAANLTGKAEFFARFRCDFNCIVDAGSPSPEEKAENRKSFENGEISLETLRSLNGVDDTDAEGVKVESEDDFQIRRLKKVLESLALGEGLLTLEQKVRLIHPEKTDDEIQEILEILRTERAAGGGGNPPAPVNGNGVGG